MAPIGEAPDHVTALRKLAVAFAIGGHFDQDDTVSAKELLRSLEAVKNTLRKQGRIGKKESVWTVLPEHLPEVFDDPTKFVPLGEIARVEKRKTGIKKAVPGGYPLVVTAANRETCDHFDFEGPAAIIPLVSSTGHGHASINRLHYQEGQFALGTILAAVFPHDPNSTSARFLFEYLSAYKDELLVSRMTGTANVTLSIGRIAEVPVPLLSLNAQSKVDELMALCDRLEEARRTREEVRDKLTAASLARLTAPDTTAEDFPAHAAFALEVLPALTTRPDQIKTLRQTILNLAVRGKLVECDDGSFQRVGDFRKLQNGYAFKSSWFSKSGVRLLRNANIGHGQIRWNDTVYLPEEMADEYERFVLSQGDIVLTLDRPFIVTGTKVARVGPADLPSLLLQRVGRFVEIEEGLADDYLFIWINSPHFNDQIDPGRSNGVPHISSKQVEAAEIFVPSIDEQHQIAAKVDALMALCDRLEAALTTTDITRTRLLDALLHETLEPAGKVLEAAELARPQKGLSGSTRIW